MTSDEQWETQVTVLWEQFPELNADEFMQRMNALTADRPEHDAQALFERACAQDSTGHSDLAIPLYQEALAQGLTGIRRRRAVIQMSSSLRNTGRVSEGLELLRTEMNADPDELDDAVKAFLALMLVDSGQAREAVSVALQALAPHLPRYQKSLANYAKHLLDDPR